MVYQLDKRLWFPDPRDGEPDGCIAVGGDLSVDRLLLAYQHGIFPWFPCREGVIEWYCPMRRFVIFPGEIHISHSMRTLFNKGVYRVSINEDFDTVIDTCSRLRIDDPMAWLGPQMTEAYKEMHRQGFAASVEVWKDGEFAGGLYGVTIGRAFFGESMCSLAPSASKIALIHLAQVMEQHGGRLIDCQFHTPHLATMGGRHISYKKYMDIISR